MDDVVDAVTVACRYGLLAVFCAAVAGKIASFRAFRETVAAIDFVPSRLIGLVAISVPLVEAAGVGLLVVAPSLGAAVLAVLVLAFIAVAVALRRRGRNVACACFGGLRGGELGTVAIVRNTVILSASALVLTSSAASSADELALAILGVTTAFLLLAIEEVLPEIRRSVDETLALLEQQESTT